MTKRNNENTGGNNSDRKIEVWHYSEVSERITSVSFADMLTRQKFAKLTEASHASERLPYAGAKFKPFEIPIYMKYLTKKEQDKYIATFLLENSTYQNLIFEQTAYRQQGETEKKLLTFDQSLKRLIRAGYEGHPLPAEVFSLIIDGLEGKLSGQIQQTYEDMLTSHGEWLDISWETQGNKLIVCTHPRGLTLENSEYIKKGFAYDQQKEFNITGKKSEEWLPLEDFDQDFTTFHYSRPFDQLPTQIQQNTSIYLPPEGQIWPAGRGGGSNRFYCYYSGDGASRGVRAPKISTRNKG